MNVLKGKGEPYPLGAIADREGVNFAIALPDAEQVELVLEHKDKDLKQSFDISDNKFGDVFFVKVQGVPEQVTYYYLVDGREVVDPYAKMIYGKEVWGEEPQAVKGGILQEISCKRSQKRKPLNETIIYRMHVRGFTKTAKGKYPGTFAGIIEKIPYLKELGITLVELMPAYDFDEVAVQKRMSADETAGINYWGYTGGNYFVPKTSYSAVGTGEGVAAEFRELVEALHKNELELGMEFYFAQDVTPIFALDCLKHWVLQYGIDAVHLSCDERIVRLALDEPLFGDIKIFSNCYLEPMAECAQKHIACYQESFLVNGRQFLKGDEDKLATMRYELMKHPTHIGIINYMANHNTFTLYDTVSYDRKYNEGNGEQNRDGTDYNYSWNCGEEGETNKKSILTLRKKQIKNALAMLFLAQGVPMLMAGDEFANTQYGNNNPYNQDNETSWLDWKHNKFQKEILEFTKKLIRFRRQQSVFHMNVEPKGEDYRELGLPDVSYHGETAWEFDKNPTNRHFAVLYNGAYGEPQQAARYYVAYNMHWEQKSFGIPSIKQNETWEPVFTTAEQLAYDGEKTLTLAGRSMAVFVSKCKEETEL